MSIFLLSTLSTLTFSRSSRLRNPSLPLRPFPSDPSSLVAPNTSPTTLFSCLLVTSLLSPLPFFWHFIFFI
jgi:hypothetical protein